MTAPAQHLATTWKVLDLIDRLVATGLYGPTREAVAEELLRDALLDLFPAPPGTARTRPAGFKGGGEGGAEAIGVPMPEQPEQVDADA
jgi:hypothetical protein